MENVRAYWDACLCNIRHSRKDRVLRRATTGMTMPRHTSRPAAMSSLPGLAGLPAAARWRGISSPPGDLSGKTSLFAEVGRIGGSETGGWSPKKVPRASGTRFNQVVEYAPFFRPSRASGSKRNPFRINTCARSVTVHSKGFMSFITPLESTLAKNPRGVATRASSQIPIPLWSILRPLGRLAC